MSLSADEIIKSGKHTKVPSLRAENRAQKVIRLEAENAELRARLALTEPASMDLWDLLPQNVRDDMAARAIFQENGHPVNGLRRIGFEVKSGINNPAEAARTKAMVTKVFDTPGVRKRLEENFSDAEAQRTNIMAVQVEIALRGTPDQAIKATQNIARLQGWLAHETPDVAGSVVALWGLVAGERVKDQPKRVHGTDRPALTPGSDVADVLSHEPGAAVRIDSESNAVDEALIEQPPDDDEGEDRSTIDPDDPTGEAERGIE